MRYNETIVSGKNGKNGKPKKPDGRKISKKLTLRQRRFVVEFTNPESPAFGNQTKAAIAAGYSEEHAGNQAYRLTKNDDVRSEINRILDAAGVTIEKLAKTVNQGLKAKVTKPFLHQATGDVVYSKPMIAHDIRLKAARLGFELRGDFAPKELNVSVAVIASKLEAARRREAERMERTVQGVRVEPEADNLGGAPQAEEKTERVQPSE